MSFILDALKKSESDRARQNGPALYEVKVAPPRSGLPLWALVVVALLGVNLAIGVWMLVRHNSQPAAANTAAPTAPPPAPTPQATTPQGAAVAPALAPTVPTQTVSAPLPPVAAPAVAATQAPPPAQDSTNPADYEPAGPAPSPATGAVSHVQRGTVDGVPLYQQVASAQGNSIPQLRLDLHVYAAQPGQRFVMINMRKLKEGDTMPEGVRVDAITPDGAVLSYNGSRFLLTRD